MTAEIFNGFASLYWITIPDVAACRRSAEYPLGASDPFLDLADHVSFQHVEQLLPVFAAVVAQRNR